MSSDRFSRQVNWVNPSLLDKRILIIGAGAVGRNIALTCASMGIRSISLCDFDKVEEHNCASQGYPETAIGQYKVEYLAEELHTKYSKVNLTTFNKRWEADFMYYDFVFLAADDMDVRLAAFNYYINRRNPPVIIDTRMRGEEIRILTIHNKTKNYYKENHFTNSQASDGNCTSQTTLYSAFITANLAVQKMVAWDRKSLVYHDTIINLSASQTINRGLWDMES